MLLGLALWQKSRRAQEVAKGDALGYVDCDDRWLCERCYHDYAETRSLGLVFSI
jgi:hypothetical protein